MNQMTKITLITATIIALASVAGFAQKPTPTPTSAEITKIDAQNKAMIKAVNDGGEAFARKDFAAAIAIYDAAIKADPTHPAVPMLLINKANAQIQTGVASYNTATISKNAAAIATAKQTLLTAAETANKAHELTKHLSNTHTQKYPILHIRKEALRLVAMYVDPVQLDAAASAFAEYFLAERDPAKIQAALRQLGELNLTLGYALNATEQFEKILIVTPKDSSALAGLTMALFQAATNSDDKAMFQRSANTAKAFLAVTPATHPRYKDVTDIVDFLKETYQIVGK